MKPFLAMLPLLLAAVPLHAQNRNDAIGTSVLFGPTSHGKSAATRAETIADRMADPKGGIVVVAHRGCHNPSPRHGMPSAPENSLAGLAKCIALGVDAMEIDVRRTRDGHLVLMHDDKVDRTTNGSGELSAMTLEQIKALRLRDNEGGPDAALTGEQVPTLAEMLTRAGNRIFFCLDVKAAIMPEVLAEVRKAEAEGRAFVQPGVTPGSRPLTDVSLYWHVAVFPSLGTKEKGGGDLPEMLDAQAAGSRRPWGYALPWSSREPIIDRDVLARLAERARAAKGRLFANTMAQGTIAGFGGDADALRDPAGVWGRLFAAGVSMFQTDEPEALVAFRAGK